MDKHTQNQEVNPEEIRIEEIEQDGVTDKMAGDAPAEPDKLAEMEDKYIRLQAEFDNFRKRTLREKMELAAAGGADVLKAILPLRDDVARADVAARSEVAASDPQKFIEGVELIGRKFDELLKARGVEPISALGQELDTDLHEAVARIPAKSPDQKGRVVEVIQPGYTLHGRVLRYAKVVVAE